MNYKVLSQKECNTAWIFPPALSVCRDLLSRHSWGKEFLAGYLEQNTASNFNYVFVCEENLTS